MRDRRLLTLAVLVVALGFSAVAMADVAVVTLIEGSGTYDVNLSLWGDSGIGSAATSGGALDFALKSISGTGDYVVDTAEHAAPTAQVTDGVDTYNAGFSAIVGDGRATEFGPVGLQPVAYDANPANGNALRDAAVIPGIGITAYAGGGAPSSGTWAAEPAPYGTDVKIISGAFNGSGGTLEVATWGTDSFSVLDAGAFSGPLTGTGAFGTPVTAIVVQTTTVGNTGGSAVSTVATNLRVDTGSITLGGNYASGTTGDGRVANVTLQVRDPNVAVNFGGTGTHVFAALDIQQGNDGDQDVDVYDARLNVYGANLDTTQIAINGMLGMGDGLYSSQTDLANEVLVVTQADDDDADDVADHVAVMATVNGDITLDRVVNGFDFTVLSLNWETEKDQWALGDLTGDGIVDGFDFTVLSLNWETGYTPVGGVVPEPATMSLLCLGALGLLRRRRK